MSKNKKLNNKLKPTLILVLFSVLVLMLVGYFLIKNWVNNEMALSYVNCKKLITKEMYKKIDNYEKNIIINCVVDDMSKKVSFSNKNVEEGIRARLEMEFGL